MITLDGNWYLLTGMLIALAVLGEGSRQKVAMMRASGETESLIAFSLCVFTLLAIGLWPYFMLLAVVALIRGKK